MRLAPSTASDRLEEDEKRRPPPPPASTPFREASRPTFSESQPNVSGAPPAGGPRPLDEGPGGRDDGRPELPEPYETRRFARVRGRARYRNRQRADGSLQG